MNGTICPRPDKSCYSSQRKAQAHADERMRSVPGLDLTVYRCRCGWWHMGHRLTPERSEMLRFFEEHVLHVVRTS
jgi:hypothetical protein